MPFAMPSFQPYGNVPNQPMAGQPMFAQPSYGPIQARPYTGNLETMPSPAKSLPSSSPFYNLLHPAVGVNQPAVMPRGWGWGAPPVTTQPLVPQPRVPQPRVPQLPGWNSTPSSGNRINDILFGHSQNVGFTNNGPQLAHPMSGGSKKSQIAALQEAYGLTKAEAKKLLG